MTPVFLDTNVWMYAAGAESSQRTPCAALLAQAAKGRVEAVTDAEVLQEFLYRHASVGQVADGIALVREVLATLGPERILPVGASTLARCVDLMEIQSRLSPRDLIHVAVMQEAGVTRMCSYDRAFDAVPGIRRVEPAALLAEL